MSAMDRISPVSSPTLSHRLIEQSESSTIGRFSIADIFDSFIAAISAFFAGIFGVKSDESENLTGRVSIFIGSHGAKKTSEFVLSAKTDPLPVAEEQDVRGLTPPTAKKQDTGNGCKTTDRHPLPKLDF